MFSLGPWEKENAATAFTNGYNNLQLSTAGKNADDFNIL